MADPEGYESGRDIGARPYLERTGGNMVGPITFNVSGATTPHIASGTGFGPLVLGKAATATYATADTDVVIGDDLEVKGASSFIGSLAIKNNVGGLAIGTSTITTYRRGSILATGGFSLSISNGPFSATGRGFTFTADTHASAAYGAALRGNITTASGNEAGPIALIGGYNSADAGRFAPVFVGSRPYSTVSAYAALFTNQDDPAFAVFDRENPSSVVDHFLYLQRKRTAFSPITYYSLLASELGPLVLGSPTLEDSLNVDPVYTRDVAIAGIFFGIAGLTAGEQGLVSNPSVDLRLRAGTGLPAGGGPSGALEAGGVRVRFGVFIDDDTVVHDGYIKIKDDAGTERWLGVVKVSD